MLSKLDRYFEEVICTICLTVLVGSVLLQVILRYVFSTAAVWAEETAVYGMIFAVYLGATMAVRERAHLRITLLITRLRAPCRSVPSFLQISSGLGSSCS
jgi:C4-dicarboxylate transporter DctM subunit